MVLGRLNYYLNPRFVSPSHKNLIVRYFEVKRSCNLMSGFNDLKIGVRTHSGGHMYLGHIMMTSSNGSIFRYWPFVQGIHRSPVNSPHKGQWRGALMFSLIFAWTNGGVIKGKAGGLGRSCAHYDVTVTIAHMHTVYYFKKNHAVLNMTKRRSCLSLPIYIHYTTWQEVNSN